MAVPLAENRRDKNLSRQLDVLLPVILFQRESFFGIVTGQLPSRFWPSCAGAGPSQLSFFGLCVRLEVFKGNP
jgi:hypothetical protein